MANGTRQASLVVRSVVRKHMLEKKEKTRVCTHAHTYNVSPLEITLWTFKMIHRDL